jgi:hypothetical protein
VKNLLIYAFINVFLSFSSEAQVIDLRLDKAAAYMKPMYTPMTTMFVSGMANAVMDLTRNHYDAFSRNTGIQNHQYWDARISWKNKWKLGEDGNPIQPLQERYWQSSRLLVNTTDAWHSAKSVMLTGITTTFFSYTFNLHRSGMRGRWYHYLIDALLLRAAFGAGFSLLYYPLKS